MPGTRDYQPWHRHKDAMTASAKLSRDDGDKALRLLDDAIALAINEHENRWIVALNHHAARNLKLPRQNRTGETLLSTIPSLQPGEFTRTVWLSKGPHLPNPRRSSLPIQFVYVSPVLSPSHVFDPHRSGSDIGMLDPTQSFPSTRSRSY